LPYGFRKNPAQKGSTRESDMGVCYLSLPLRYIVRFEAKRLSTTSNNKEYVSGSRGGIERFKRGLHASDSNTCGMFAYIQNNNITSWVEKVNKWIDELSCTNKDDSLDWTDCGEKLVHTTSISSTVEKYKSCNKRKQTNDSILIWHYFMDLRADSFITKENHNDRKTYDF
jgi:hypothetical protein